MLNVLNDSSSLSPRTAPPLELRHPRTGGSVTVPLGFSLPVAVLGPIPLLMHKRWRLAALTTVVSVLLPVAGQILMATRIHRLLIKDLLARGYRAVGTTPGTVSAAEWTLGMSLPRYRGPKAPD
ncbi:hypothetical protein C7444_11110 [Sphaerotilus hippei]|uniref:Uncharacterized protein n=1 Tax=Sphaerotilus hippei TaxID=744406 RepID=A0A318GZ63_9BURK|nr:DUF2628 domain-containing protein [Sphaerotilus hippei]PXW94928.1 hypothetical protein C7444_11110 [Sphaerotilus hippei]